MQIFNSFHPLKRSHITPPIGLFFITWFEILKFRFHPVHDRIGLRKLLLQLVQNGVFRISRVEDAVHMTGHPSERAVLDNAGPHHRPHIDHEQVGTGHPYPGKPRSFRLVAAIAVQLVTVNFEKTIRQTIPRFVFLTPQPFEQESERKQLHLPVRLQVSDIILQKRKRQIFSRYRPHFFLSHLRKSFMKFSLLFFWSFINSNVFQTVVLYGILPFSLPFKTYMFWF